MYTSCQSLAIIKYSVLRVWPVYPRSPLWHCVCYSGIVSDRSIQPLLLFYRHTAMRVELVAEMFWVA